METFITFQFWAHIVWLVLMVNPYNTVQYPHTKVITANTQMLHIAVTILYVVWMGVLLYK